MLNPKLKPGDRIVLLQMDDEFGVPPGTAGEVTNVVNIFNETQYDVKWDNGSTLGLIEGADAWVYEEDYQRRRSKKIQESKLDTLSENKDLFDNFDVRFLSNFMKKLRESGIINMFAAVPYSYMGKERIYHENYSNPIAEDNPIYDEVLEMANEAQSKMITGVIKVLESEGKEPDISNINRYLKKYSRKLWSVYAQVLH